MVSKTSAFWRKKHQFLEDTMVTRPHLISHYRFLSLYNLEKKVDARLNLRCMLGRAYSKTESTKLDVLLHTSIWFQWIYSLNIHPIRSKQAFESRLSTFVTSSLLLHFWHLPGIFSDELLDNINYNDFNDCLSSRDTVLEFHVAALLNPCQVLPFIVNVM